ncbi:hypothetical protein EDD21DRAFT_403220 [Dissophora ornata]|nr:hypothetical protein EDD21DRAFT_403220 [Dissophora ornata]
MYHGRELRRYQYFALPTWSGGIYTSAAIVNSCSVCKAIKEIPGLYVYGDLKTAVAFNSENFNIFDISDEILKRGWRLSAPQNPPGVRFTSTTPTADASNEFIVDLLRDLHNDKITETRSTAGIYNMVATIPLWPRKSLWPSLARFLAIGPSLED